MNITIIKTIVQHANQLSKLTLTPLHFKKDPFVKYFINDINYYDILESVKRRDTCKLTIVHIVLATLAYKYPSKSQTVYILNMVDLLTVKQETYSMT